MRYLAIDFGDKRTGLAVADDETKLALPLDVIETSSEEERLRQLRATVEDHNVSALVLGLPLNMDGSEGMAAKKAQRFASVLRATFSLPVYLVDERLTSEASAALMAQTSLGRRKRKIHQNAVAAAAILRDFLEIRCGTQPINEG